MPGCRICRPVSGYTRVGLATALWMLSRVLLAAEAAPSQPTAADAKGAAVAAAPSDAGAAETPAPPEAAQPKFDVLEYRVQGNTTLPTIDVEKTIYPFLGPGRSMKDVESARVALEALYHDRGFNTVFVDIPEQSVDDGIVRLHVTQGRLRRVAVTGARYFSGRQIKALLPSARADSVPNLPDLQNELTALNTQTPDRTVVPVLRAGPEPGTVDLALKVDDHLPVHGSVEVNNQNTAGTSSLRANATVSYDNLFGRLDSLSLQYQTSPQDTKEVKVFAGGYTARLNDAGTHLALFYINSDSTVASIGTLGVIGKGQIASLKLTQPLVLTGTSSQSLSVGVDFKDFQQTILVDPTATYNTPIAYFNWSLGYSGNVRDDRNQFNLNGAINFGSRGLRNDTTDFGNKRYLAPANYAYVRADASYLRVLPGKFTALVQLGGQYSVEPLISNEEFTIGGASSVRGYFEAEGLGDMGVRSSFQLGSPPLSWIAERFRLTSFLFFDAARVSTLDGLPNEFEHTSLRSWGAGLNFVAPGGLAAAFTWADPLVSAHAVSEHYTRRGDSRWLFSVHDSW